MAQDALEKRFLDFVTPDGRILTDLETPLQIAGLRDGDHLTVIADCPTAKASVNE